MSVDVIPAMFNPLCSLARLDLPYSCSDTHTGFVGNGKAGPDSGCASGRSSRSAAVSYSVLALALPSAVLRENSASAKAWRHWTIDITVERV